MWVSRFLTAPSAQSRLFDASTRPMLQRILKYTTEQRKMFITQKVVSIVLATAPSAALRQHVSAGRHIQDDELCCAAVLPVCPNQCRLWTMDDINDLVRIFLNRWIVLSSGYIQTKLNLVWIHNTPPSQTDISCYRHCALKPLKITKWEWVRIRTCSSSVFNHHTMPEGGSSEPNKPPLDPPLEVGGSSGTGTSDTAVQKPAGAGRRKTTGSKKM